MKERMQTFMQSLENRIGNYRQLIYRINTPNAIYYSSIYYYIKDENVDLPYGDELIDVKVEEISDAYLDDFDDYIKAEIIIPVRDELPVMGKLKKQKWDASDNQIGEKNSNPILDTSIYELEFLYGRIEDFVINVLDENLFNQAELDGWYTGLIDEVIYI